MNSHRHLGVYGICHQNNHLLVIKKNQGPYKNRYDLPGGSVEPDESLVSALKREFVEEVGMTPTSIKAIGVCDFFVRWERKDYTHEHHIALFYEVRANVPGRQLIKSFDGQDSDGVEWIQIDSLSISNSSPLVLQAIVWLTKGIFSIESRNYDDWLILS